MKRNFSGIMIGLLGVMLTLALSPAPAMAAKMNQDVLDGLMIQQGEMNGIRFMSGGVGLEERTAMRQMAGNYNAKLAFATLSGCYLADVKLTISGAGGKTLLELTANGPWVYAKLPEGEYHVTAVVEGKKKVQKVMVGSQFQTLVFYWKSACDRAK
jgi:hypothetical protein